MGVVGEFMFNYRGIKINYKDYGNQEKDAVVFLHGWGQNIQMMEPIATPLEKTNRLIILDLPGFGKSEEPKETWSLQDYAEMVHALLKKLKIENPYLIGHSFGGKISILYASQYKVKRMVLLSSPFKIKMKKLPLKVRIFKFFKKVPILNIFTEKIKKHVGSLDYRSATPTMRNILVKHVNTELVEEAKKIKCPTFIIWGSLDDAVPVEDAHELEKLIPDSGLVVYDKCTHYAYLERLGRTNKILKEFIK